MVLRMMTNVPCLALHRETVRSEWIDYNGHMNVAYYVLAFDNATETVLEHLGIGGDYVEREQRSVFVVESHVLYRQEVTAGTPLRFESLVLGVDRKRLHLFHRMFHADENYLAATNELLLLHVDMVSRRTLPFAAEVQARIAAVVKAHTATLFPEDAGRVRAPTPEQMEHL